MDCRRIQPGEFLSVMREQLNYRPAKVTASDSYWNPDQELHRQAVHPSTELEVYPATCACSPCASPKTAASTRMTIRWCQPRALSACS